MAARGRYNRDHEPSGDVYGVLEFLCAGAPATGHADFSHDWNTERMESVGRRDYFAPAVAGAGRDRGSVCVRMVLAFFCRAQSPGDIWASVVVLAGRSENGGDGASGENGRRSETMHGQSEYRGHDLDFYLVLLVWK